MQKIGTNEADIEKIKNEFMVILRDVKTGMQSREPTEAVATTDIVQNIFNSAKEQAQNNLLTALSADDIASTVAAYMGTMTPLNPDVSDKIKDAMSALINQFSPDDEESFDE